MTETVKGKTPGAGDARSARHFRELAMTGTCPDCGADLADDMERLTPLSGVHEFPSPREMRDAGLAHAERRAGRRARRRAVSEDATVNAPTPQTRAAWTPEGEVTPAAPQVSEDAVIAAIATVYDPEIPVDIYELGLIYAVEIADDGKVKVEMTLTTPSCPSAQELPSQVEEAVRAVPGVTDVHRRGRLGPALGPDAA